MIQYINCSEADKDQIFQAFKEGFSDYIIKIEPTIDFFYDHFFGAEGNDLKYSWLALDETKPVGLVLGGIRTFDGLKTIRCGTMCVIPDYRGKGISSELLKLHEQTGRDNYCKQMFLECIVGNDRALRFYEKNGYRKVFDLSYFAIEDFNRFKQTSDKSIVKITMEELKSLRETIDIHINWQNEIDYIKKNDSLLYGIKKDGQLLAAIVIKGNLIQFLYVLKKFRNMGNAQKLMSKALKANKNKMTASFPNNSSLEGFYRHLGFNKEKISQVEMYKSIRS